MRARPGTVEHRKLHTLLHVYDYETIRSSIFVVLSSLSLSSLVLSASRLRIRATGEKRPRVGGSRAKLYLNNTLLFSLENAFLFFFFFFLSLRIVNFVTSPMRKLFLFTFFEATS